MAKSPFTHTIIPKRKRDSLIQKNYKSREAINNAVKKFLKNGGVIKILDPTKDKRLLEDRPQYTNEESEFLAKEDYADDLLMKS